MTKNNLSLSSRIQSTIFNLNIMSHLISGLLLLALGLINFSDLRNMTISYKRLTEESFWVLFLSRYISYFILRFLYTTYGSRKKKEENIAHIDVESKILESRKTIELDDRLEEFREYVEEEVELYDLLETYEKLLSKRIFKTSKKVLGFILTKNRKKLIEEMYEERKNIRQYMAAINSKDEKRIEESLSKIDINKISIKKRVKLTPDIIFDGLRYEDEGIESIISFNEGKAIAKSTIGNPIWTLISTMTITLFFQGFIWSTDNWLDKTTNLLVTIIMGVVTVALSINNGNKIADKLLQSKNSRLRHLTVFMSRPKKEYPKLIKIQPEDSIDVIEGI